MFTNCIFFWMKRIVLVSFIAIASINPAQAGAIDFDDIPYIPIDPDWPQFYDVEVTDQYLSEGVLIEGGYLGRRYPEEENIGNPQFLLGSNFMRMIFVGERLPNYVTMTISSAFDYANIINFYGPDGHLFEMITSGSQGGVTPGKPYRLDQPISFTSHTGISEITFEGFYGMRWGTFVDNVRFKSSPQALVPEPGLLLLFCMGLIAVVLRLRKQSI